MSIEFSSLYLYILVFVRLAGCFLFNAIFSRKNIPAMLQMGFILVLTILITPTLDNIDMNRLSNVKDLTYILLLAKELFLGLALGYIFQIFSLLLFFVGDMMDLQFGLSMAKVFDPGTNIQMAVMGSFINIFFIMFLFATNSHLILIKIFAVTFDYLPVTSFFDYTVIPGFVLDLFINTFILATKLLIPYVITGFTIELSMGILMKVIPQIHIFVINIQIKILLGITLMLALSQPMSAFLDRYIVSMLHEMQQLILHLAR